MSKVPIGAIVGNVRVLSAEEAIETLRSESYMSSELEQIPKEFRDKGVEMLVDFIERQNLICGMDDIGQVILYWHGPPSALIVDYWTNHKL